MTEQAGWVVVPDAALSMILWSDVLPFQDRMRCQEVCKTWRNLLQKQPSGFVRKDLSPDLCIRFGKPGPDDPPTFVIALENGNSSSAARDFCCRWLRLHAHLIRKVQLSGDYVTPMKAQEVFRALQVASPQTPPAMEVNFPLGSSLTKSYVSSLC